MKTRSSVVAGFLFTVLGIGCAAKTQVLLPDRTLDAGALTSLLKKYPLADDQNIRSEPLRKSTSLSCHLVQIRGAEAPHVHATHDVSVTLLRGNGVLHLDLQEYPMRAGDVALVPQRSAHYFVNTGREPAVAFVTFAPPYDGRDQVPIEQFKPGHK